MAYFNESGGNTESDVLSDKLVSNESLRVKVKQILSESQFYQVEPIEVLSIKKDTNGEKIQHGKIIGRFIYSEKGLPYLRCSAYKPLGSNIMQLPIEGEVVLGLEFFGERFYLPLSVIRKQNDSEDLVKFLNQKDFGISNVDGGLERTDIEQGDYFRDTKKEKTNLKEGDTIIQGRFGNYIKLSSNQIEDLTDKLNPETAKKVVEEKFLESPNIELNVDSLNNESGSKVIMTSNELISYSDQVIEFGKSMSKIQPNGSQFETNEYSGSQVYISSDRIVFNAEHDDVAIFAKNRVHIKGGAGGVQISNAMGNVSIKAKEVVSDFKGGKKLEINKDLTSGDVILAPDQMKEMGQVLAKQVEWNLDFLKVQIGSLIPAAIPGTKSVPNPAWFANIKAKIDNAKKLLEFNDLVFKLKWLDKTKWKTYNIDELKEAFKPVPGFGGIIEGFKSLKQVKNNIGDITKDIDKKIKVIEQVKSGELLDVSKQIDNLKNNALKNFDKKLGIDEVKNLKNSLNELDKTKQKLSGFKGGNKLKGNIEKYEIAEDNLQNASFEEVDIYRKERDKASENLRDFLVNGEANGFEERVSSADLQISSMEGSRELIISIADVGAESEKIETI